MNDEILYSKAFSQKVLFFKQKSIKTSSTTLFVFLKLLHISSIRINLFKPFNHPTPPLSESILHLFPHLLPSQSLHKAHQWTTPFNIQPTQKLSLFSPKITHTPRNSIQRTCKNPRPLSQKTSSSSLMHP